MKVYELNWERGHLVDENDDCSVVPFNGLEEFRFQLGGVQKYSTSNKVILQGNFNIIPEKSDFPVVDIGVPLMSNRMLSILEADKTLLFNKVDSVIVDDTYLESLFDDEGRLIENVPKNIEYKFFQVLNYTDAFDRSHSLLKPMRSNPEKIGIINKLVLREPNNGFPAIFRIEEKPSMLFINEITKNKFEHSKIKGCSLREIDTTLKTT
jgi:hypothetical protein